MVRTMVSIRGIHGDAPFQEGDRLTSSNRSTRVTGYESAGENAEQDREESAQHLSLWCTI